jgi:hypothetical protein
MLKGKAPNLKLKIKKLNNPSFGFSHKELLKKMTISPIYSVSWDAGAPGRPSWRGNCLFRKRSV